MAAHHQHVPLTSPLLAAVLGMDRYASETTRIDAEQTTLTIAPDGEPTELQSPLEFRSRAPALQILVAPIRNELGDC